MPFSYFMCHCTEYKLLALQVKISEEIRLNATTQQWITTKISGCVLRQRSKTHSSLRQTNLQLQIQAALMSCQMRAVEQKVSDLFWLFLTCKYTKQKSLNYKSFTNPFLCNIQSVETCSLRHRDRGLKPSRPILAKMGLETSLETQSL